MFQNNMQQPRFHNYFLYTAIMISTLILLLGLALMFNGLPTYFVDTLSGFMVSLRLCETDCSIGDQFSPSSTLGWLMMSMGCSWLLILRYRYPLRTFIDRYALKSIQAIVGVFAVIFLPLLAYFKYFSKDTLEHVHCAWMMHNGLLPYVDFFQNHNPLLWILLVPLLKIGPESSQILIILRMIQVAGVIVIFWLTDRLARQIPLEKETRWLALFFMVTMPSFFISTVDLRPDLGQVILSMFSILFFLRSFDQNDRIDIGISGFAAGLAFLFLQKAVFLFVAYGLILSFLILMKRIPLRSLGWFLCAFLTPVILFVVILWNKGMLSDYLINTWHFNLYHLNIKIDTGGEGPLFIPHRIARLPSMPLSKTSPGVLLPFKLDNLFWFVAAVSSIFCLLSKLANQKLKIITLLGLFLWLPIHLLKIPYAQYLLPAIPLLSIAIAYATRRLFQKMQISRLLQMALFVFLSFTAGLVYFRYIFLYPSNASQRHRIDYVLARSDPQDRIYDGDTQFNLFRRDLHYFWHYFDKSMQHRGGLGIYNFITNDRFGDYDICVLVKKYRPRFISTFGLKPRACGIADDYCPTPIAGLLIRAESGNCEEVNP